MPASAKAIAVAAPIPDVGVELIETDHEVGVTGEEVLDVELGRHPNGEHRGDGGQCDRKGEHQAGPSGDGGDGGTDAVGGVVQLGAGNVALDPQQVEAEVLGPPDIARNKLGGRIGR